MHCFTNIKNPHPALWDWSLWEITKLMSQWCSLYFFLSDMKRLELHVSSHQRLRISLWSFVFALLPEQLKKASLWVLFSRPSLMAKTCLIDTSLGRPDFLKTCFLSPIGCFRYFVWRHSHLSGIDKSKTHLQPALGLSVNHWYLLNFSWKRNFQTSWTFLFNLLLWGS